jgi:hypothetical protein
VLTPASAATSLRRSPETRRLVPAGGPAWSGGDLGAPRDKELADFLAIVHATNVRAARHWWDACRYTFNRNSLVGGGRGLVDSVADHLLSCLVVRRDLVDGGAVEDVLVTVVAIAVDVVGVAASVSAASTAATAGGSGGSP